MTGITADKVAYEFTRPDGGKLQTDMKRAEFERLLAREAEKTKAAPAEGSQVFVQSGSGKAHC